MFFVRLVLLLLALSVGTERVVAGIILSIDNAVVSAGDMFSLDVRVQGDLSYDALTERLDFFVGVFRIAPVGFAPAGGLTFDDPQLNSFDTDGHYVFLNNSFGLTRDVTMNTNPMDTLTIIDWTNDFLGVDVTSDFLLARLELVASPALLDVTQYQVSLVGAESQFQNENFEDIGFGSTGGLITINGPPSVAAVPEPSGVVGFLIVSAFAILHRRSKPATAIR